MLSKKNVFTFLLLLVTGGLVIALVFEIGRSNKENKMIIEVDGFEVEYIVTDRQLTIEDFENIELGSSVWEIADKLGDPDTWIGSGMLRPVYFLEDGDVVVCNFGSPSKLMDLNKIEVFCKSGESKIIKRK